MKPKHAFLALAFAAMFFMTAPLKARAGDNCSADVKTTNSTHDLGPVSSIKRGVYNFPGGIEGSVSVTDYHDRQLSIQGHSLMNIGYVPSALVGDGGHYCEFGPNYTLHDDEYKNSSCSFLPYGGDSYVTVGWSTHKEGDEGELHAVLKLTAGKVKSSCPTASSVDSILGSIGVKVAQPQKSNAAE